MKNKKLNSVFSYFFSLLALLLTTETSTALAQANFPEKPVRIVVPFPPGGGTDLVVRALAAGMATELNQSFIIENKAGAGTVIGTDFVAKSPPDGYTLLVGTFAFAVNPSLLAKLPFDTNKAFDPVVLISRSPNVLVVRADSPYGAILVSAIVLVGFAVMLWLVIREVVPANQRDMVTLLLGTLAGMASSVVAYWVGSSNGSMQKNAALEKALAQK